MRKTLIILFLGCIVFTGCSLNKGDPLKEFTKKIENSNSYILDGTMEIINNEDTYTYDVNVSYKQNDNFVVELNNIANNHKQVILRNSDGVYVITPSLNKSFKFQSDWPYNNSQVYLLSSLVEDLNNDENRKVEEKDNGYILTSKVNYPNNKKLVKQIITLDKNYNVTEVQVMDENNNTQIKMAFNKIDLKAKLDDDHFKLNNFVNLSDINNTDNNSINQNNNNNTQNNNLTKERAEENRVDNNDTNVNTNTEENSNNMNNENADNNNNNNNSNNNNNNNNNNASGNNTDTNVNTNTQTNTENTNTTATIDDIIYPMYLPNNTYLKTQEKIDKKDGQRLILTFEGDSPFVLIEETITMSDEHVVIPTFGELTQLSDTIGVVNDNSVNWYSGNIEYYVASDALSKSELLEVARSISVLPVSK